MTSTAKRDTAGRLPGQGSDPAWTWVDLTFRRRRVEQWIRFGAADMTRRRDRFSTSTAFATGAVFGCIRWQGNEHGTVAAQMIVARAVGRGEPFQTLAFIRPGAEILLNLHGWPRVTHTLAILDAIEAQGIDPAAVSPEHWRHVHNRLSVGVEPIAYTGARHAAWLARRGIVS